jgi:hypothetical protein
MWRGVFKRTIDGDYDEDKLKLNQENISKYTEKKEWKTDVKAPTNLCANFVICIL